MDKHDPLSFSDEIMDVVIKKPNSVFKAIYTSLTGISSVAAIELCVRAGIDADASTASLKDEDISRLRNSITAFISDVKNASFKPNIVFNDNTPVEYAVYELTSYNDLRKDITTLLVRCYPIIMKRRLTPHVYTKNLTT